MAPTRPTASSAQYASMSTEYPKIGYGNDPDSLLAHHNLLNQPGPDQTNPLSRPQTLDWPPLSQHGAPSTRPA